MKQAQASKVSKPYISEVLKVFKSNFRTILGMSGMIFGVLMVFNYFLIVSIWFISMLWALAGIVLFALGCVSFENALNCGEKLAMRIGEFTNY